MRPPEVSVILNEFSDIFNGQIVQSSLEKNMLLQTLLNVGY